MMLLLIFDLPRSTKEEAKAANEFRKHLISIGFSMKQHSKYERPVQRLKTRDKILNDLKQRIPTTGQITVYELPDEVNNNQIVILGNKAFKKSHKNPQLIVM